MRICVSTKYHSVCYKLCNIRWSKKARRKEEEEKNRQHENAHLFLCSYALNSVGMRANISMVISLPFNFFYIPLYPSSTYIDRSMLILVTTSRRKKMQRIRTIFFHLSIYILSDWNELRVNGFHLLYAHAIAAWDFSFCIKHLFWPQRIQPRLTKITETKRCKKSRKREEQKKTTTSSYTRQTNDIHTQDTARFGGRFFSYYDYCRNDAVRSAYYIGFWCVRLI